MNYQTQRYWTFVTCICKARLALHEDDALLSLICDNSSEHNHYAERACKFRIKQAIEHSMEGPMCGVWLSPPEPALPPAQ